MKKFASLLFVFVLIVGILCSCAAASSGSYSISDSSGSLNKISADSLISYDTVDQVSSETDLNTQVIRRMTIKAETKEYDKGIASLKTMVSAYGGYFAESSEYTYNYSSSQSTFEIRIPADKLDEFAEEIEKLFNVHSVSQTSEDVTEQYFDLKAQYDSLLVQEEKLEELLTKADNLSDYFQIDDKLTSVRSSINSVSSKLQYLEKSVSMSYVTLTVAEVVEYTQSEDPTFLQRIGEAFVNMANGFVDVIQWLVIALVYVLPVLVIALIVLLIILLCHRKSKKKNDVVPAVNENKEKTQE